MNSAGMATSELFKLQSRNKEKENRKFLSLLKKKDSRRVDAVFHAVHKEVFEEVDCLQCANCCRTTSPIFYQHDIERVARSLRMKPGDFVEKYLRIDVDRDYVLKSSPCPFLEPTQQSPRYGFKLPELRVFELKPISERLQLVCQRSDHP